ncbi:MAG: hypothetical protein V3W18_12660, partial [candidate division Zixibacteria bacterium]
ILMTLGITIPLVARIGLPVRVTPDVRRVYDYIENLNPGDVLLISYDHDTGTLPEMVPMSDAILRHTFSKDLKIVGMALRAEGSGIGRQGVRRIAAEFGKEEGIDFVFLGFRPEITAAILGIGSSIAKVFPKDDQGVPIEELPLMNEVRNYSDIALVISITDDDTPIYWINYANARFDAQIVPAVTAVMATSFFPFLNSGQAVGMVAGLKGAAEYEKLIGVLGSASRGMDAQSIAHLVMIGFILIGNLAYFLGRRD